MSVILKTGSERCQKSICCGFLMVAALYVSLKVKLRASSQERELVLCSLDYFLMALFFFFTLF